MTPTRSQLDAMRALPAAIKAANNAAPELANCERCQGSGEDPEGFMTSHLGPDDYTVDGPCRQCGGSGDELPSTPSPLVGTDGGTTQGPA